ncbi:hypothetical protein KXW77_000416, partial [Aspergillus fumigatus]
DIRLWLAAHPTTFLLPACCYHSKPSKGAPPLTLSRHRRDADSRPGRGPPSTIHFLEARLHEEVPWKEGC